MQSFRSHLTFFSPRWKQRDISYFVYLPQPGERQATPKMACVCVCVGKKGCRLSFCIGSQSPNYYIDVHVANLLSKMYDLLRQYLTILYFTSSRREGAPRRSYPDDFAIATNPEPSLRLLPRPTFYFTSFLFSVGQNFVCCCAPFTTHASSMDWRLVDQPINQPTTHT